MASENNPGILNKSMVGSFPHRPSTAVWTNILRTTTMEAPKSLKDMPIIAPPMAPLDKNAISMRVLLHDTQANFEKFTVNVGKLFDAIQETQSQLKIMHSLFQRDREALTTDIVDLVNRSQKEIQKSIGTPLQSDTFEKFCNRIDHRLESLDQRLESMNAFNQTHSQTLQNVMQTAQLILDKQGSILSTITPILPSLQGLPSLIDGIRTGLTNKLDELCNSPKNSPQSDSLSLSRKRKRNSSPVTLSSDDPIDPHKKPSAGGLPDAHSSDSSGQGSNAFHSASSPMLHTYSAHTTNQDRQASTPRYLATPSRHQNTFAIPSFPHSVSRRRLSAVEMTTSDRSEQLTKSAAVPLSGRPILRSHTKLPAPMHVASPRQINSSKGFAITPTSTPRHMPRVQPSDTAMSRSNSVVLLGERQATSSLKVNEAPDLIGNKMNLPKNNGPKFSTNRGENVANFKSTKTTHVAGRAITRAFTSSARATQSSTTDENEIRGHSMRPLVNGTPLKEGRRFIPLLDWDDDDEYE